MKRTRGLTLTLLACGTAAAVVVLSGCENGDDGTENASFYIDPGSVSLSAQQTTAGLMAVGGHEPLAWTVSDESLGTISGNAQAATYTRTSKYGVNIVTCTDSMSWKATCTISYNEPSPTNDTGPLAISPASATLTYDGAQTVFTVTGGRSPYAWTVGNTARGHIETYGATSQTLYTRDTKDDNTVVAYDSDGHMVSATVSQPATATLAISPATATVTGIGSVQVLTVAGGSGTYTWSMNSGDGTVSPGTGNSTVYTSASTNTTSVVKVTDSAGVNAFSTIQNR